MKTFKRYTALAGMMCVALLGLFLYLRVHYGRPATLPAPSVAVLPKEDKEQLIIDPSHHSLIIVRSTGNETLTLPDRQSVIDIRKDGTVSITSPQYGWEHRLFLGVHVSNTFRVCAGMDAFYFKKLDIGLGVAEQLGPHAPVVFAQVGYNVYGNCRIGVVYGSDRLIGGTLTVRL